MTDKIVILTTCASEEEGERLGRMLVEARLAGCVTVMPKGRSYYHWKGAVESAEECLLIIKSSRPLFEEVRAALEKAHSYEVPEMLAIAVVEGAENYLLWLSSCLKTAGQE